LVYYLNHGEIEKKRSFLYWLAETARGTEQARAERGALSALAEERMLHLALECVTDLGNLLIDGFMMRDPSSYEDIIEILKMEEVMDRETADGLIELVRLRRALLQEYADWDRTRAHPLIERLPDIITSFADQAEVYIKANQL
jgi:uncharacterized protein YutE (UPF0331/DUF86 family)